MVRTKKRSQHWISEGLRFRMLACAAFVILVSFLAPFAIAQDPPKPDLGPLNLEQLMKAQFYTASKPSQDASETPASVTVITRTLRSRPPVSLSLR
jgi:hypothetical protein